MSLVKRLRQSDHSGRKPNEKYPTWSLAPSSLEPHCLLTGLPRSQKERGVMDAMLACGGLRVLAHGQEWRGSGVENRRNSTSQMLSSSAENKIRLEVFEGRLRWPHYHLFFFFFFFLFFYFFLFVISGWASGAQKYFFLLLSSLVRIFRVR